MLRVLPCLALLASPALAESLRPWTEYSTILWLGEKAQPHVGSPLLGDRLRELGINTGMVGRGGDPKPLLDQGFGFYVENLITRGLCLKFQSGVTNWDQFVTRWKDERSEAGLVRDYSLEDPVWRSQALDDMRKIVRRQAPFQPLAYDIRDELSTTVSANPFDYDFSEISLAGFRQWLQRRYGDLAQLNRQWGTQFASWDAVKPFTTDRIKQRQAGDLQAQGPVDWAAVRRAVFRWPEARQNPERWNFSPWADHRSYMDATLAGTLGDLRAAARTVDPHTPVGIEGTQMPHAFGGYDLWRLAQVLDWVEPYDICNAREIFGAFMPGKPILATVFEKDTNPARRRLWHLLLEGDRGCIVWWSEDVIDWTQPGLPLTAKGRALAPVLRELTTPLARLFLRAERERDPIALHYSQPSIQVAWLLESAADGATWLRRFSSYEADHNRHAQVRNAWLKAFQDLGFSPVFLAGDQLAAGPDPALRVLVLPQSRAMSEAEVAAVQALARRENRLVIADGRHGLFDQHGRLRRQTPWLDAAPADEQAVHAWGTLAGAAPESWTTPSWADYPAERLQAEPPAAALATLRSSLEARGVRPPVRVPVDTRVRVHRFRIGGQARLVAFERNIEYKMREELAQAGGNEALERPARFQARLAQPAHVTDLRTGRRLGRTDLIDVELDPWQPSLFALTEEALEGEPVAALMKAQAAATAP